MAKRRGQAYADGYAEVYAKYLAWPSKWHEELATHCKHRGIDYMATVFLPEDVAVIAPYVNTFKLASFESADDAMWKAIAPYTRALHDPKRAIASLGFGQEREQRWRGGTVSWLHCVSAYPAPIASLELARIHADDLDGFSDHSDPALTHTGAWAVMAGATIIEAHLRLDGTDQANPDYPHAMTPRQFAEYVAHIRFAEQCLGDGEKRLQDCERAMARYRVGAMPTGGE
jgi:sialic acid synthase SpsE